MHTSLTSTTYPYLIISLDYTLQNENNNNITEKSMNEENVPKNKVTDLIKEREKLNSTTHINNEYKGEVYIALWRENRLYFYNKEKKLVFRSNQKTEMYNHFVNVIYDMNFKDLSQKQIKTFDSTFRIVLDKNTISYDESVNTVEDYYICFIIYLFKVKLHKFLFV